MNLRIQLIALLVCAMMHAAFHAAEHGKSKDPKKETPSREEKLETLLSDLEKRCKKMLDMQIAVHKATITLHKTIEGTTDKKPRPDDRKAAMTLAEDMKKIVTEANRAIDLLEKEGSAVAFPEVFRLVRKDMEIVQARLEKCDLGKKTQELQQDIIDTLREMTAALEKK